jgi:hypothetical protein
MDGRKPLYRYFTGGSASFKKAKAEKQSSEQATLFDTD